MPYSAREVPVVDRLIAQINADSEVQLVLHVGDIKGGSESCGDALLRECHQQIQRLAPPVLFAPGDNEWTDCHRVSNGRHLPTERLDFLRKLFFPNPARSGGQRSVAVQTQAAQPGFEPYVEHALLEREGLLIATLHVVGSDNNLLPWGDLSEPDSRDAPRPDRLREVRERDAAVRAWVDQAFDTARRRDARAVVLAFQANPGLEHANGSRARRGFDEFVVHLRARAAAFGRPVWLLHGDHHLFIYDRPLARPSSEGPEAPLLRRVQTFGSPLLQWVKLTLDPSLPELLRVETIALPALREP